METYIYIYKKGRQHQRTNEKETYTCKLCHEQYKEGEDWVECDYRDEWFHYSCTYLAVLDALQPRIDYTCKPSQTTGYPSHVDVVYLTL